MFAIHANNQLGYHLAVLPLSIPWWRSGSSRRVRRHPPTSLSESMPSSFREIADQLYLSRINLKAKFFVPCPFTIGNKTKNAQWVQSFVTESFLDKRGNHENYNLTHLLENAPLLTFKKEQKSFYINPFAYAQQIRTFKTARKSKDESLKGFDNISSRIKTMLPSEPNMLKTDFLGTGASVDEISEAEKLRIKLAFAEGYTAAQKKTTKFMKMIKLFQNAVLLLLVILVTFTVMASAAGGNVFKLQLNSQVEVDAQEIDITFNDVKGVDEAKQELKEIVEFLKNPDKFSALGGKLPKGALLVGPPGTGKTLLARAVAGEAGVPFFHAAGSEFDEILVGQGARRVRDLFQAAKNKAPCVIFIDEIDAVGGKRTNSVLHPYANQTINQLLSEMDGFHQNEGVIVLGATNRREDLDKALLRPGRFDVEVHVNIPDYTGRKEIFELYLKKIQCKNIDIDILARGTIGFTGADIENMVNLAALKAAIDNAKFVSMKDLENARDKVLMGPARKSRIPDEEANEITAYHESGHAIVAYYTKDSNPIHKVTIIPRGPSLGHTAYIPKKEHYHTRKSEMLASMDTMMGGRAAEEIIYGPDRITSGAASDLKQATAIATHMVKELGMSDKVGLRTLDKKEGAFISVNDLSPSTNEMVDQEIKKMLHDSYERAKTIIKSHAKEHKQLAEALLKYETLEGDDVKAIMNPKKEAAGA